MACAVKDMLTTGVQLQRSGCCSSESTANNFKYQGNKAVLTNINVVTHRP